MKINETKLRNRLFAASLLLIIIISVAYSSYIIGRTIYLDNASKKTQENILKLEHALENIDYTNASYIIDVFYAKNSIYTQSEIDFVLQKLWSYELYINGEKATLENINILKKVENVELGGEITVEFRESMQENILPYSLSKRGSIVNSDFSDSFFGFVSFGGATPSKSGNIQLSEGKTSEVNKIIFKYIKTNSKANFNISFLLKERLNLGDSIIIG